MKTNLRLIGGKKLQSPNNSYTRPTTLRVREAIFNILNNRVENSLYVTIVVKKLKKSKKMIEPLLCGIVLGLVPITLLGLFVSAWNQYRRGSGMLDICLLYTSPSPRDATLSRMPSSA